MDLNEVDGAADGGGLHVGVVVSTFNEVITSGLLQGALEALKEAGTDRVTVVRVPGALELPVVARRLVGAGCHAVVALGAVIEGETDHYQHVATQSAAGLMRVALDTGVPVANAVLTVRDVKQARDRSLAGKGNKGYEAAMGAVTTATALQALGAG